MQGHLTPLLRLSRRIAAYKVPVHYVGSATTLRQAAARADEDWNTLESKNFHLHSFPTPSFQNLSPNSNSRVSTHLRQMISATLSGFDEPLSVLVNNLSSKYTRVVVIFDALMASTVKSVDSVSLPNVESYVFETSSAFTIYSAYWENFGKPKMRKTDSAKIMREIPSMEGCFSPEFKEFVYLQYDVRDFHSGTIFNSCRLVEGLYLDLLTNLPEFGDKIWAVGPFNPVKEYEMSKGVGNTECSEWLLNQPYNSVLLVSFGTASSLSDEQIEELAMGLERSGVSFVWLLRDADRGDIFADGGRGIELPLGFEERVRERGMVVREWESQVEILVLDAIGGFLTNCGWNSCMESITTGVPIAAWPMHSDQPRNTVLMTKVLEIGVEVRDWQFRDGLVYWFEIERAVRRVMGSAEGVEMRERVEKLADLVHHSWRRGSASSVEMDSFIEHIRR